MRGFSLAALGVLSVGVAGYAVVGYALYPIGAAVHPDMRVSFAARPAAAYCHVFAAAVALLLGPIQFLPAARGRYPVSGQVSATAPNGCVVGSSPTRGASPVRDAARTGSTTSGDATTRNPLFGLADSG